jgi:hypothetical protein
VFLVCTLIPFITTAKYSDILNILKDRIGSLCVLNTYIYVDISGHCDVDPRFIFCNPDDGMRWWIWFLNLQVRWAHPAHEVSVLWSMLPGSCGRYSDLHSSSPVQRTSACFFENCDWRILSFHGFGKQIHVWALWSPVSAKVSYVGFCPTKWGNSSCVRVTTYHEVNRIKECTLDCVCLDWARRWIMPNLSVETVWNASTWNSKKDFRLMFWSEVHGKGCRLCLSDLVLVFFSLWFLKLEWCH